jgi:hypothetical protein
MPTLVKIIDNFHVINILRKPLLIQMQNNANAL